MIFEDSVYNVKYFWNRGLNGSPICSDCLGDFKSGDITSYNYKREKLGLKPERIELKQEKGLDQWLKRK